MSANSNSRNQARREKTLFELPNRGDINVVVAYPNRYWVAMSNLGFQAVYKLFAETPRFHAERTFIPDKIGAIKTFESNSLLSNAQILAVSVSFETDYPQVLSILESAGVRLESCLESERGKSKSQILERRFRPFVLGGGASLTLNPEPLANFFDAILIGEGEEAIPEFAEIYKKSRDRGWEHSRLLESIQEIEGMYVPSLVQPIYAGDILDTGTSFQSKRPRRRFLADLDSSATTTVIQTPDTEFKSMFMTETGRGCEIGCKFCVAGYMYRPIRKRSATVINETINMGVECADSIGFVGAAVSSHPDISEFASRVARLGKRASLSSIMTQKVTSDLSESLSESEYKTVALAPEAGSEGLRFRIGKRVCDEQILNGIERLAIGGIRNFKLYFMVGLPSEEESDVEAIGRLVSVARERVFAAVRRNGPMKKAPRLVLSVNPFIPKAWTPFQRHSFLDSKDLSHRLSVVRKVVRGLSNVELKYESPRESYFQAFLSRGDRRVGDVLLKLHRERLDWRWLYRNGAQELVKRVPPADYFVHRTFGKSEALPWETVDLRIKRSLLERLYRETFEKDVGPLIQRAKVNLKVTSNDEFNEAQGVGVSA